MTQHFIPEDCNIQPNICISIKLHPFCSTCFYDTKCMPITTMTGNLCVCEFEGEGEGSVAKTGTHPLTNSVSHNKLTGSVFVVGNARWNLCNSTIRLKHGHMADGGKMESMFMPCSLSFKVLVCSLKIEQFFLYIYIYIYIYKDIFIE